MKLALVFFALALTAAPCSRAAVPSFDGIWQNDDHSDYGMRRADKLPLGPAWRIKSNALDKIRADGGTLPANDSQCIPEGMPSMMQSGTLAILGAPNFIQIFGGRGLQVRNIRLDQPRHTEDRFLFDSFGGESIGHWEGQTLVVDTIAIRDDAELLYALKVGKPHVVERFTLTTPNNLKIETTVTDPVAFTRPWTYRLTFSRDIKMGLQDSIYCIAAYDRDVNPSTGDQTFDLTPPAEEGIGVPQSKVKR